jgi:hypothetical protein
MACYLDLKSAVAGYAVHVHAQVGAGGDEIQGHLVIFVKRLCVCVCVCGCVCVCVCGCGCRDLCQTTVCWQCGGIDCISSSLSNDRVVSVWWYRMLA